MISFLPMAQTITGRKTCRIELLICKSAFICIKQNRTETSPLNSGNGVDKHLQTAGKGFGKYTLLHFDKVYFSLSTKTNAHTHVLDTKALRTCI